VTLTNGLIRAALATAEPQNFGPVVVYTRPSLARDMLNLASLAHDLPMIVYGCDDYALQQEFSVTHPWFVFKAQNPDEFARDLAACRGVICTAGNQLLTEARHLGKLCLLVPEPKQYEQQINAHYAEVCGFAHTVHLEDVRASSPYAPAAVHDWLDAIEAGRPVSASGANGVDTVTRIIRNYL
jgi:hypothetical protein